MGARWREEYEWCWMGIMRGLERANCHILGRISVVKLGKKVNIAVLSFGI